MSELTYGPETYRYQVVSVTSPEKISLYQNKERKNSVNLAQEKGCTMLTNGSFYDEAGDPIGWFVSEGKNISEKVNSNFLNGFMSISPAGQVTISSKPDPGLIESGLQSGPLLVVDGKVQPLSIKNDEPRRRLIAAKTTGNQLIFIAIVDNTSLIAGPLLAETPAIVDTIANQQSLILDSAINLDGGSASTLYTKNFHLKEASWIGSFFCSQENI